MTEIIIYFEDPASVVQQINASYFLALVSFTLLYHDYILTLGDEIRFFWGRKTSSVALLYFANRYISTIGHIPVMLQTFRNWSLTKYHQFFSIFVQIIVGVIAILRTYALYELSRTVAIWMAIVAAIAISCGIWSVLGHPPTLLYAYDLSSFLGCHPLESQELGLRLSIAWGSLLCFDSVVVILTLRKAMAIRKLHKQRLFYIVIRDGTIYYFVFALINLAQIIIFVIGPPHLRGICTIFANSVSSTLISRLMLNLQNARLHQMNGGGQTMVTTLGAFASMPLHEYASGFAFTVGDGWYEEEGQSEAGNIQEWDTPMHSMGDVEVHEYVELSPVTSPVMQDPRNS